MKTELKKLSYIFLSLYIFFISSSCPKFVFNNTCNLPDLSTSSSRCSLICSTGCLPCGSTTYVPRSQGSNTVRELIGWNYYLHAPDTQECYRSYGVLDVTFEYTRSFNSEKIAHTLFCTDCLTFAGSQAPNRTNTDIVADNFGLAPNFYRSLKIEPVIQNYILDINFYANLSDWFPGLYIKINIPITHTIWDLGLDESVACASKPSSTAIPCVPTPVLGQENQLALCANTPTPVFPANYMTLEREVRSLETLKEGLNGNTFGDMLYPWEFGKWSFCPLEKTAVADIDLILGLNFYESLWNHIGIFIQAVAPTGNKPTGKYLFEPIAGNRGHWELGGGLSTHFIFWASPYADLGSWGIYFEGNVTHVFKSNEIRAFDFTRNGLLSRYLLLKEFVPTLAVLQQQSIYTLGYHDRLINAINFATRNAQVEINAKGDATLMLSYVSNGLGFDIGYNIYGRSKELVCIKTDCPCDIDERFLGIKGTEGVGLFQYSVDNGVILPPDFPTSQPLNSTQSRSTIFAPTTVNTIDNPSLALTQDQAGATYNSIAITAPTPLSELPETFIFARFSVPPVIVSCADLNPNSAVSCAQLTHKIFVNFSYRWLDTDWDPHINLGAEIEFDHEDLCKNKNTNNLKNALNQWGIWLKMGIVF